MTDPSQLIRQAVWLSLTGAHAHLALRHGSAARYPTTVLPFAAIDPSADPSAALTNLANLLSPSEPTWLFEHSSSVLPAHPHLQTLRRLPGLHLLLPELHPLPPPDPSLPVTELGPSDLPEMLGLIERNFPGFFLPETPRIGRYFGIRTLAGQLVSMLGERFAPSGYIELSALCTEHSFRGQGHAAALLVHLARVHRAQGLRSWLGVAAGNTNALALYTHLGFQVAHEITFTQLARTP